MTDWRDGGGDTAQLFSGDGIAAPLGRRFEGEPVAGMDEVTASHAGNGVDGDPEIGGEDGVAGPEADDCAEGVHDDSAYAPYDAPSTPSVLPNAVTPDAMTGENDAAAERLREARMKAGYGSAREAATHYGWTYTTYQKHENGERAVRPHVARKYAAAFGVKAEWLLFGKGKALPQEKVSSIIRVPVVGTAAAGYWAEPSVGEAVYDYDGSPRAVEEIAIPPHPDYDPASQYAVRVEGSSTNRVIGHGGFASCVKIESYPGGVERAAQQRALVHVERLRGELVETTLKRIDKFNGGYILRPDSTDPRHQKPVHLGDEDRDVVRVVGVAVGKYEQL